MIKTGWVLGIQIINQNSFMELTETDHIITLMKTTTTKMLSHVIKKKNGRIISHENT